MDIDLGNSGLINFLGRKVFRDYEPCQFEPFENRFAGWLGNVETDEEKKVLEEVLLNIFYVGRKEFESLYRTLYGGVIANWIIDQDNLDLFDETLSLKIHKRVNSAWICPITDSLRINSFMKVNSLIGMAYRPDWKSLEKFSDLEKIKDYVKEEKIERLILLEDFVGSGTQSVSAVKFAADALPDTAILFCPLVVCPKGDKALAKIEKAKPNLTYRPSLVLPDSAMIGAKSIKGEPELHVAVRALMKKYSDRFKGEALFGFKGTGALVVLYSNCPNNTLPAIHHSSDKWAPLFPRVRRAG